MYLFFDLETTGLPKKRGLSYKHLYNWPHIVQISWYISDADINTNVDNVVDIDKSNVDEPNIDDIKDYIIKPSEFEIPIESSNVHGITNEYAIKNGMDLKTVLNIFACDLQKTDVIIAHNIEFDSNVLLCEMMRLGMDDEINLFKSIYKICTMKETTELCKIPFTNTWCKNGVNKSKKYKWPKLSELYSFLFNEELVGAHNSKNDVLGLVKCFNQLNLTYG